LGRTEPDSDPMVLPVAPKHLFYDPRVDRILVVEEAAFPDHDRDAIGNAAPLIRGRKQRDWMCASFAIFDCLRQFSLINPHAEETNRLVHKLRSDDGLRELMNSVNSPDALKNAKLQRERIGQVLGRWQVPHEITFETEQALRHIRAGGIAVFGAEVQTI